MKAFTLVAAALLLGATTMFARGAAPDGNPRSQPASASQSPEQRVSRTNNCGAGDSHAGGSSSACNGG